MALGHGSILAGMVLYVALHGNPDVNHASVDSTSYQKAAINLPRH